MLTFTKLLFGSSILLFSQLLFTSPVDAATISGELKKWHKVTLTFDGPFASETSSPNPFSDYRLLVTFSKGGQSYQVPGYFAADGNAAETSATSGNKWRVHFSPDATGTWTYSVSFRQGTDVAISTSPSAGSPVSPINGETGSFVIANTDKTGRDHRGKGRLLYVGEHYLQYAETGEWFVKGGVDSPENALDYEDFDDVPNKAGRRKSWSPHAGDYSASEAQSYTWQGGKGSEIMGVIRYLSNKGLNAMSFITFGLQGGDHNVFPHRLKVAEETFNNMSNSNLWANAVYHDRFDVSRLAQWERAFSYADQKGVFLHFKTQEKKNDTIMNGGDLGRERKLYYRELISRFAHHLALNWNMGEETTLTEQQHKDMAAYFAQTDPYGHLRVLHTRPGAKDEVYGPLLGNASSYTGASLQTSSITFVEVFQHTLDWVSQSAQSGKKWVVAVDEPGNGATGINVDPFERELTRHKVLWATFMAGGVGTEYYYGFNTNCTDVTCQDHRSRDDKYTDVAIALKFFQTHFQSFLPNVLNANNLTNDNEDYVLAKANEAYAIYRPTGGSTNISLPAGSWQVQWYHPSTGVMGAPTTLSGNTLTAPDNNDWVALILPSGGCPVGASCDDGNPCTINDTYDASCNCIGTVQDSDNDGICDADDSCPDLDNTLIGTACDDGDPCTIDDIYTADCGCAGTPGSGPDSDNDGVCDANDSCPDFDNNLIGTACDDGDPCTIDDVYTPDCGCAGTLQDSDSDGICDAQDSCPDLDDTLIGTSCDDGDPCTTNDVYTADCGCAGTFTTDSDNDGICDTEDNCPGFNNNLIGTPCDDGDPSTINDIYTEDCGCAGITPSDTDFWLEAECATVGSSWVLQTGNGASGNESLSYNGSKSTSVAPATADGWVTFTIDVTQAGAYEIFVRSIAPDGNSDSYWVRANQSSWVKFNKVNYPEYPATFAWSQVGNWTGGATADPVSFNLTTGTNTIDFAYRESGITIDKVFVTLDGAEPFGTGQPAANCEADCTAGTSCDDNNDCTVNDQYDADCNCIGTFEDSDSDGVCDTDDQCNGFDDNLIGTSCDDGDPCTANDVYTTDCGCAGTPAADTDNDGICDAQDSCPDLDNSLIGASCDDGDPCTNNDVYTEDCGCAGTLATDSDNDGVCDLEDSCPGFDDSLIGTPCNDGDPCTSNDVYTSDCECAGTPAADTDNDGICDAQDSCPGLDNSLIGTSCDDGDPCTINDVYMADCECAGSFQDSDNDGICNADDTCPGFNNNLIGTPCDDGNPSTFNDVYTADCECAGSAQSQTDFWLEAECATVGSSWVLQTGNGASGNESLSYNGSKSTGSAPATADGWVRFTIDVTQAGAYETFVRSIAPNGNSDSYWVRANQGSWVRFNKVNAPAYPSSFAWSQVGEWNGGSTADPVSFNLTTGTNTIDFAYRESGITIDKVFVTLDGAEPTGSGQTASNCAADCTAGTACDDNNDCTVNDQYDADCNCIGTFEDSDSDGVCDADDQCSGFDDNLIGTSCDDGDPCTANDIYTTDCGCAGTPAADTDNDGICDAQDSCPGLDNSLIGASCDDGDPCTNNDVYTADCGCAGTLATDSDNDGVCDLEDSCPGFDDSLIGTPCNDGDPCTSNDVYTSDCGCAGTPAADTDNDGICDAQDSCPGLDNTLIGTSCDDGDPCTINDVYMADCECAGSLQDSDNDGICDADDTCPGFNNNLIGTPCDDGDPSTFNDVYTTDCECAGSAESESDVWLEAECGEVGNQWQSGSDPNASEGTYMEPIPGNTSTSVAPFLPENHIRFTFNVNQSGSYNMFVRAQANGGSDDSFWIRANEGDWIKFNGFVTGGGFAWVQVFDSDNGSQLVSFDLIAGGNTVDFAYREDGTYFDKLYLSLNDIQPIGLGNPASNCMSAMGQEIVDPGEQLPGLNIPNNSLGLADGHKAPSAELHWRLFPNPGQDLLNLQLENAEWTTPQSVQIRVMDSVGKQFYSEQHPVAKRTLLHLSALPAGAYWVEITSGQQQTILRWIKM